MASNIYLLHFTPPFRHAGHYLGYTSRDDVQERVAEHLAGRGAVLVKHAVAAGCEVLIAKIWTGVKKKTEKKIKGRGLRVYCPLCSPTPRKPRVQQV